MADISPATHIIVKGAKHHNLKNIDLTLPKNKLIVVTGLSGSGKSSLAFDTIYAEGQRKYVESLSAYARQFLGLMQKPDVDQIQGLSPAISIDQKTTSHNPRSTVGTITEIYDYLRLLFARIGHPHCPNCGREIKPQSIDQIQEQVLNDIELSVNSVPARWLIMAPVIRDKRGEYTGLLKNLRQKGFTRARIDGYMVELDDDISLIKTNKHTIEVVIDRISLDKKQSRDENYMKELRSRIHKDLQSALEMTDGLVITSQVLDQSVDFPTNPKELQDRLYSQDLACHHCNLSFGEVEPRLFSFNTPHGACTTCSGLGNLMKFDADKIIAPDITISEGAIIPLTNAFSNNTWLARKVKAIIEYHLADWRLAWKYLPDNVREIILHGDTNEYEVTGTNSQGYETTFSTQFDGVLKLLEQRHSETSSDFVRSQLEQFMTKEVCPSCHGARLKPEALAVKVADTNIHDATKQAIKNTHQWIQKLEKSVNDESDTLLSNKEKAIAKMVVREISARLNFLMSVGLDYLTLDREAGSLSGGEAQRIRLASQIGTGLTGVLYVLDEPSIGLHPRDNTRLIETLQNLRDLGNTVLVVEHDKEIMEVCDYLVDIGPRAGLHGGNVVYAGLPSGITKEKKSITGDYLSGKRTILAKDIVTKEVAKHRLKLRGDHAKKVDGKYIHLKGAKEHNLKDIDVKFPLGKLVVVTGVSGSGKSTLVHDTLYPALRKSLGLVTDSIGSHTSIEGQDLIDRIVMIDQSPIGRTPRSNPATYTKSFDIIRQIFAQTREANEKGYKPGRFSFNVKGGRCESCSGDGQVKISMQFLPDVYVTCEVCKGKRYNSETLGVHYKEKTIADVLDMTIEDSLKLFKNNTNLYRKLATLNEVGLTYMKLGQPAPTLSGGEAQRIKLAKELSTLSSGHTVYLLDEPTTGLHFEDVKKLLKILKQLVANNNTIIVIEHNLDVIKNADWVIDLGPEGGDGGGQIIAEGKPRDVAKVTGSYTGTYLAQEFAD